MRPFSEHRKSRAKVLNFFLDQSKSVDQQLVLKFSIKLFKPPVKYIDQSTFCDQSAAGHGPNSDFFGVGFDILSV